VFGILSAINFYYACAFVMKIVHIITRLVVGGAQENTLLSCEGQHDLGHDVTLITGPGLGPEGTLIDRARAHGYRVIELPMMRRDLHPLRDIDTYRQLKKHLREIRPDVVHTHSSKAGIIGRWAARRALRDNDKTRIVHTIHGLAFTASTSRVVNTTYRWLENFTALVTHKIVCVADAMAAQSLAGGVGKKEQYTTVYSGMDTRPFVSPPVSREEARAALRIRPDDVVVGTIARLFHLKGHDDLLALAPRLCEELPALKFLWVGGGLLREAFEKHIAALGLRDRFVLTGLVPPTKIPELVGAMDILVHPSRREGLARALPQGQLAGCPVVTYDIDGNREGLIDGSTGYCLPPFDVDALGDRVAELVCDADRRRTMGQRGRAFALARFDTRVMIDGLEKVYQSIL